MPLKRWIESTNYAIEGILHAAKTQRHLRYHLYAVILILLLSLILGITRYEFIAVAIVVLIVLSAEMLNTAIEAVVDTIFKEYNKTAKEIKDVAAGAVLISAIGASVVGYIIFLPYFKNIFSSGLAIAKQTEEDIAIIALVIVLILVIIAKTLFGRGLPLRGGMPSGHAAVAFAVWVAVSFISEAFLPSFLVLILAVLIAQSRVSSGIHKTREVILGALFGSVVTFLFFKLFQ
jgi:diacylglycerol kinase (ATP)